MKPIIGLVGPIGSGKTTSINFLKSRGYNHISLTDELKKEVKRRKLALTRENFLNVGDDLRKNLGNDILAIKAADKIEKLKSLKKNVTIAVEGLKNPGEINYLKSRFGMFVLGIEAKKNIRLKRVISRASILDKTSDIEIIRKNMKRDEGTGQKAYGNRIDEAMKLADKVIMNDSTIEKLHGKIDEVLT